MKIGNGTNKNNRNKDQLINAKYYYLNEGSVYIEAKSSTYNKKRIRNILVWSPAILNMVTALE